MKEYDSERVTGDLYCVADELLDAEVISEGNFRHCGSSDAMSVYENSDPDTGEVHYTSYCFSCNQSFKKELFAKSSHAVDYGIEGGVVTSKKEFKPLKKKERITKPEVDEILSYGYNGKGSRGIKDEYSKFFGQVTKLDRGGTPIARYYPETKDGKLTGYKCRNFPKDFRYGKVGITGIKSDLAGQVKFKNQNFRDIVICGGEEDMTAFFQIYSEYQKRRYGKSGEEYLPLPVVSPTTGESSAIKQVRENYDFINSAENIILALDNDKAGKLAMEAIAEIFPKEKVKIVKWSLGDPNAYIHNEEGKDYSAQALRDFFDAKDYENMGIVTSREADCQIEEELLRPKIALPDFMSGLQDKMAGGVPLGYWVNFIAESGIGKSTLVNEAIRHFLYNAPYKVGILSLELSSAQYFIAMLSREVGYKINLIEDPHKAVEFVRKPEVVEARNHLSMNEFGEDRFVILDEREGSLNQVKKQCELLINKHGCQILVIDPIQDLFEGVSMDEQNSFVKWMKGVLKRGVTFINVCHVRKGNTSTDKEGRRILRELSEDDVHGISAIIKSAGANIFMSRNKYADHSIEKNTTFVTLGKCRWSGHTGRIGSWYYSNEKHTMYDLKTYFKEHPDELGDYDLENNPFMKGGSEKKHSFNNKPKAEDSVIKMEVPEFNPEPVEIPNMEE